MDCKGETWKNLKGSGAVVKESMQYWAQKSDLSGDIP
jgi:hypothetical protein